MWGRAGEDRKVQRARAKLKPRLYSGVLDMPGRIQKFVVRSVCLLVLSFGWVPIGAQMADPGNNPQPPATKDDKASPASGPLANSNIKLGPGDLIEVSVLGVPDLAI